MAAMDRVSAEHRDLSCCKCMALTKSGSLCLIAGANQMGLVNLNQPDKLVTKQSRSSKHDVGEIQFSLGRETLCAIASGNKVDLVDFREGGGIETLSTLKGHGNLITDLSFHEQKHSLLATASFDNFVYVWDTRQSPRKRPAIELSNMSSTTKCCWERITGKHLATAHDGVIKIWDIGKNLV